MLSAVLRSEIAVKIKIITKSVSDQFRVDIKKFEDQYW